MDNTTSIAYINKMGGTRSQLCNNITVDIWKWAQNNTVWLSAAHIQGLTIELKNMSPGNQIHVVLQLMHSPSAGTISMFIVSPLLA